MVYELAVASVVAVRFARQGMRYSRTRTACNMAAKLGRGGDFYCRFAL